MNIQEWIPFTLSELQMQSILDPKCAMWLLGLVLLVAGARYYLLLIMAPGFALGVALTLKYLSFTGVAEFLVAMVLGSICAAIFLSIEKLAVSISGAFVGVAVLYALEPYVFGGKAPFYSAAIASLLGCFIFPKLYDDLRPVVCALSGALCIAWSVNKEGQLMPIVVMMLVGALLQYTVTARSAPKATLS